MKNFKTIVAVMIIFSAFTANAQFKFGLAAGVNMNSLHGDVGSSVATKTGYHGGVMAEFKLPVKLGIEADLLYSLKGAEVTFATISENQDLAYLDLPIVGKWYMFKIASIQLGVQYSQLLSASSEGSSIKDQFKAADFAYVAGVGVDVLKFHASLRYAASLTSISIDSQEDIKNGGFMLTAGLWLK